MIPPALAPDASDRLVLRLAKGKYLSLALLCAGFGLFAFWAVDSYPIAAWVGAPVVCMVAAILLAAVPTLVYLVLTPAMLTIHTFSRKRSFRWDEVASFGSMQPRMGAKRAGFDLVASQPSSLETVKTLMGFHCLLPMVQGLKPEELAELLNRWRDYHTGRVKSQG